MLFHVVTMNKSRFEVTKRPVVEPSARMVIVYHFRFITVKASPKNNGYMLLTTVKMSMLLNKRQNRATGELNLKLN